MMMYVTVHAGNACVILVVCNIHVHFLHRLISI